MKTNLGRRLVLVAGCVLGAGALAGACSSTDDRPAPSTSSSSSSSSGGGTTDAATDATADASDAAPTQCTPLSLGKSVVEATYLGGDPPSDTGGTLVPGTYDLTRLEVYLGTPEEGDPDSGPVGGAQDSAQATLVLTATTLHEAKTSVTMGVVSPLAVSFATVHSSDGLSLVADGVCPLSDERSMPFSSTPTTITFHTAQTRRETFTLRP